MHSLNPISDSCSRCGRRQILGAGIGLAALSVAGALPTIAGAAGSIEPVPIPWLDKNGSHNQPPMPGSEPSEIYNFRGQVASSHVAGSGKDGNGTVIPFGSAGTDFRYMAGEYVAADGSVQRGIFAHIWLDLFAQGPLVLSNKIHDLHPKIAPSGLYWTVALPASALTISADGRSSSLKVTGLPLFDEPQWPTVKGGPYTPATMSFVVEWTATGSVQTVEDSAKHFKVVGFPAQARASFQVSIPAKNFTWQSDPIETSTSEFAIMGSEVNGSYYDQGAALPGPDLLPRSGGASPFSLGGLGLAGLALGFALRRKASTGHDRAQGGA